MIVIKGVILFCLLLYASVKDVKYREVNGFVPLCILITALIDISINQLPQMLIAMFLISLPQLIIAMKKPNSYGGADIKIMGSCAFLLEIEGGFFAIIIGLVVGLSFTFIKRKIKKESLKTSFPVVPCLSFGTFLTFLLKLI